LNKIPKNIKNENCNKIRMDGERLGFCLLGLCVLGQMSKNILEHSLGFFVEDEFAMKRHAN